MTMSLPSPAGWPANAITRREPVPQARPGSEVTLWGRGPGDTVLAIDDVARAAGTIGYELMCALAPRVPVHVEAT